MLYLLDTSLASPKVTNDARAIQPTLVVDPVSVVPLLDNDGIIYQVNPHRVVIARDNQWAAPLPDQLTDNLYTRLVNDMPDVYVLNANAHVPGYAYRLTTQVDRFEGLYRGVATIAGTWQLFNRRNECVAHRRFEIEIPLHADGYLELVHSLSRGWRKIIQGMATSISSALAGSAARIHEGRDRYRRDGQPGFLVTKRRNPG
ncbi:MAG: PqiC family protein [Gammaproteobacteria bacterium]